MKNVLFYYKVELKSIFYSSIKVCSIMLLSAILSCSRIDLNEDQSIVPAESNRQVDVELVKEVSKLPRSLISLGYVKLSNSEKELFWESRIDKYLNEHTLSNEVRNHILLLKNFVTPDLYKNLNQPSTQQYIKEFTQKWYLDPMENNTVAKEVLLEVGTMYGTSKLNSKPVPNLEQEPCECRYSVYCIGPQECIDGGCKASYSCGIAGTSECTGKCG